MAKFKIRGRGTAKASDSMDRAMKSLEELAPDDREAVLKDVYDQQDNSSERREALNMRLKMLGDRLKPSDAAADKDDEEKAAAKPAPRPSSGAIALGPPPTDESGGTA
ncbi:MAG: hypothetical protein AAFY97_10585 [Pseudomonadota bacterium]